MILDIITDTHFNGKGLQWHLWFSAPWGRSWSTQISSPWEWNDHEDHPRVMADSKYTRKRPTQSSLEECIRQGIGLLWISPTERITETWIIKLNAGTRPSPEGHSIKEERNSLSDAGCYGSYSQSHPLSTLLPTPFSASSTNNTKHIFLLDPLQEKPILLYRKPL